MDYPIKRNGYIYSKGTKAGFIRMQRHGIPRPIFSIQDRLAKIIKAEHHRLVRSMLKDIKEAARSCGVVMDSAPIDPEKDEDETLEDLIEFFTRQGEELKKETEEIINRANMQAAENTLEHKWMDTDQDNPVEEATKEKLEKVLKSEQKDYMQRLMSDAGSQFKKVLVSFTLDKQQIFNENMANIRKLYLDNSIQRLSWEQDDIKRRMLARIHDYVTGKSPRLEFDDLLKYAYKTGDNLARLFARDQMQRFNKALTLSTFKGAGVTKVKWMTANDQRVRPTHKALNGKIFDVDSLPDEVDDYNCRCGLIPVEWEEV